MARKKSNKEVVYNNDCCEEDVSVERKVESPDVTVNLSVKPQDNITNDVIITASDVVPDIKFVQEVPEPLVLPNKETKPIIENESKELFEPSEKKVKVVKMTIRKPVKKVKIDAVKVNLTNVPKMSKYKKTKKPSGKFGLNFTITSR